MLKRILLFGIPFGLYALCIYAIDPFSILNGPQVIPREIKFPIANELNPCLWKMNQFHHQPRPNILLGDSRMNEFQQQDVSAAAGAAYFNLSYGGASLKEMIDSFWFAQRNARLENVFIGLNLNVYNDYNSTERTRTYLAIERSPAIYFVNRTVLQAAWDDVYSRLAGVDLKLGVPQMSREDFWRAELGPLTEAYYTHYLYPVRYKSELQAISEFCRAHNIHLAFVILPTHVELQNRIADFHLSEIARRMRTDLSSMAPTYDFDYPSEITRDAQNFRDPYHFNAEIAARLVDQIWGNAPLRDGTKLP